VRQESSVQHKLKQAIYRHLQKVLRENFRQRPESCRHHRTFGDASVGVCGFQFEGIPRGSLCDSRYDGVSTAKSCPWFEVRQTKEEVKAEFRSLFEQPDRGILAAAYPEVASLLWVLDSEEEASLAQAVNTVMDLYEREETEE
jgi:hypothetical protein